MASNKIEFGEGITAIEGEIKGKKLILTLDIDKKGKPLSKSGKSTLLATTQGNKVIPETDIVLGVNCYVPIGS